MRLVATALLLSASAQGADAWGQPRTLVFGDIYLGWMAVSAPAMEARPIRVPGKKLDGLAIAGDGVTVAFTAFDDTLKNNVLYRWRTDRPEVSPVSIGDTRGYHADPFVSGEWVYFSHSPFSRGPPGAHGGMAFAELWRVRLDGSGLEQLTSSIGCHVQPFVDGLTRLFYTHVNCGSRGMRVEQLGRGGVEALALPGDLDAEPEVSPDGKQMLVSVHHPRRIVWERWSMSAKPARLAEGAVAPPAFHARPRFGRRATEVLYQTKAGVFVEEAGKRTLLSSFDGGGA